jgi:hypothetical protein
MSDDISEDDLAAAITATYSHKPKLKELAKPERRRRAAEQAHVHKYGTRGGRGRPSGRTEQMNSKIKPQLKQRIKRGLELSGLSLADFMELAFTDYLNRHEKDWAAKHAARAARGTRA